MMPQFRRIAMGLVPAALLLSSCQQLSVWMTRNMSSNATKNGQSSQSPSVTPTPEADPVARRRADMERNSQLLQELYRVVMVVNPRSPADFGNWVDSMNQGASLEGVYNGFTRSGFQRQREADPKSTATPRAIGIFARELADLLLEFPQVPELTARDAKPLGAISLPGEAPEGADFVGYEAPKEESFQPFSKPSAEPPPARPSAEELAGRITKIFAGSSIFTLKRVLGDWGLRVLALRSEESPERMKDWYAEFASKAAKKGVDFGLVQRSEPSREFHRKWADTVTDDMIRWEVLNRLHRILNAAQGG